MLATFKIEQVFVFCDGWWKPHCSGRLDLRTSGIIELSDGETQLGMSLLQEVVNLAEKNEWLVTKNKCFCPKCAPKFEEWRAKKESEREAFLAKHRGRKEP